MEEKLEKNVEKISQKIVPEIVQKYSQKLSQNSSKNLPQNRTKNCKRLSFDSLGECLKKCKKYKKLSDWELCMVECRNYGVTKKTSSYLFPCTAKSNSMWKVHSIKSKKTQIFMSLLFEWPFL